MKVIFGIQKMREKISLIVLVGNICRTTYRPISNMQFSVISAQSCPTVCNPINHSTPGLPVHQQLPEFTQTHVHWVSDAIQPSHPLSFPSPPALNLSQHQGLLIWVSSSHQVAKVLEFQLQHQSDIVKLGSRSLNFFKMCTQNDIYVIYILDHKHHSFSK